MSALEIPGPDIIQVQDFYLKSSILHPLLIGSIATVTLFIYLRLGSNRSITPLTTFDWLINVALGSTLAGIVNGNSLARGLLALTTMLAFQYLTSTLGSRFGQKFAWVFQAPPLLVVFRGRMLEGVMRRHRISPGDVNAALRQRGVLSVALVECGIIEPNGSVSVVTMKEVEDAKMEPEALTCIPAYRILCEREGAGNYLDNP